jgi:tetratricopeptide (TPR) repeat protein
LQQSLTLLRQVKEGRGEAFALITVGANAWIRGQYPAAKAYLEQSVAIAESSGVPLIAAFARAILGRVAHSLGHYAEAERLIYQSLPVLREQGRLWGLGINLSYLGSTVLVLGRPAEARQLIEESLAVSRAAGDRWTTALALSFLGRVLSSMGETERREARLLQQQSAEMYREIGNPWGQATALQQLGQVCYALGEFSEAHQHTYEALQVAAHNGIVPLALGALVSLAELRLTVESDQARLVEWLAVALNHPASDQANKDRATRLLTKLEASLPGPAIETALARGKAKTLDTVMAEFINQS